VFQVNSVKIWTEFYLNADIEYLAVQVRDIKQNQLLMAVDNHDKKVYRGFAIGFSGPDEICLYCLDLGIMKTFPFRIIYATTEIAAKTEFQVLINQLLSLLQT